ncbi:MAG: twin-arginine translocase subunit TatC [Gammaproteobacteria bacterium]|jgi:sec-independent protein translocase protein TatC|nr:twin-arginine translocase subunit TatC [Gammaproteobacteria bacterium]MBT3858304.1 twin-arginine translocase subunit TatC [Gammaproteobacteria bacterium]MBT3988573.1 twin-arginine translocase subunit TatC [Gammaproteobacteria bacterium]MBT4257362.1 twin-arginine translocase subunit TatC [Gammaproteobacteria bacterium]MBT4580489.1 twin-arginine translocase subunit TatC [Gammaproteobacteria bacterium]
MTSAEPEQEKELTLIDHLIELRDRILRSVIAVLIIFLALFYFANDIYTYVATPLIDALPEGSTMIAIDPTSPFFAPFKLTFYVAFLLAAPYVLYQLWSFIAPGLYKNEKSVAIPLFISSVLLFYSGIAFARYLLFGFVFSFFISVAPEGISVAPDISSFLNFALSIFLGFGIAFEVPIAVFIFIWSGMVEPDDLASKRPYVIVGCFIVGMLMTPADPISQSVLAIPMWLLFEAGIIAGRIIKKKKAKEELEEESKETE